MFLTGILAVLIAGVARAGAARDRRDLFRACRQEDRERLVDRASQMLVIELVVGIVGRDTRPRLGFGTFLIGRNAIGAAIGVSSEPRPASSVVMMPYISPELRGRDTVITRCWPCRLVTR